VAFSPDSRTLASGGDDEAIKLWDIATGKEIRTLRGKGPVWSVIFSPSGNLLASAGGERFGKSSDNTITLWYLATGKEIHHFQGHKSVISSLAFSGDEKILVSGSSSEETIILWQVPEFKE
jgi:WD40 repeat protein